MRLREETNKTDVNHLVKDIEMSVCVCVYPLLIAFFTADVSGCSCFVEKSNGLWFSV